MTEHNFTLQPFSAPTTVEVAISGSIARSSNALTVRYALIGEIEALMISDLADKPIRKNGLWRETCFELFLAVRNRRNYWEFNMSPSGHWNVYRFVQYRQGMQEERAFLALPIAVSRRSSALSLGVEVDLDRIADAGDDVEIGVSAVTRQREDSLTYWALVHCRSQPDFHDRASFVLNL